MRGGDAAAADTPCYAVIGLQLSWANSLPSKLKLNRTYRSPRPEYAGLRRNALQPLLHGRRQQSPQRHRP